MRAIDYSERHIFVVSQVERDEHDMPWSFDLAIACVSSFTLILPDNGFVSGDTAGVDHSNWESDLNSDAFLLHHSYGVPRRSTSKKIGDEVRESFLWALTSYVSAHDVFQVVGPVLYTRTIQRTRGDADSTCVASLLAYYMTSHHALRDEDDILTLMRDCVVIGDTTSGVVIYIQTKVTSKAL